jgi:hypothetical protein
MNVGKCSVAIVGWSSFQETEAFSDCQRTQDATPPRSKLASFAHCRQHVCFRRLAHWKLKTLALWIPIFFFSVSSVWALDSNKRISPYAHTAWLILIQDGHFSGTPQVMTLTADGYLWFGTNTGQVFVRDCARF